MDIILGAKMKQIERTAVQVTDRVEEHQFCELLCPDKYERILSDLIKIKLSAMHYVEIHHEFNSRVPRNRREKFEVRSGQFAINRNYFDGSQLYQQHTTM